MATGPEQVYEEVGEGPTLRQAGATPTEETFTSKQMYEEVGGGKAVATPSERKPPQQPRYEEPPEVTHEKGEKQFSTQREAETSHC